MDHHAHETHDHHSHQRTDHHDQQHFLELDAEVFGGNLAAVLDLIGSTPRRIVDIGAGTGAGSRLLHERYPDAAVTCVDNDPVMLEMLRRQGFRVVEADLDKGFPALPSPSVDVEALVDLVWASSSLHHVAHPDRLLSGVRSALAPGGVLVVVELAGLPQFLTAASLGDQRGALLEQHCHAAAAAEGWNRYPDWTPAMQAAGFRVSKSDVTTAAPVTPAAREYAQQWFTRFAQLTGLTADDRSAIEALLGRFADLELEPRTTRTVWVGHSDQEES
ncbi:MAG: class I SAM-dependent methyltransferase [Nakamurella sp.]